MIPVKRRRIWAVIHFYHPNFSGAAIQNHRLFSRMIERYDTEVTVLTPGVAKSAPLRGQKIQRDRITVRYQYVLNYQAWRSLQGTGWARKALNYILLMLNYVLFAVQNSWVLLRQGKRGDIVQLISCEPLSFVTILSARLRGMHTVIQLTLVGSDDPLAAVERIKRRQPDGFGLLAAFRFAERIVSLSSALTERTLAAEVPAGKILQIPVGVDMRLFHPVSDDERAILRDRLGLQRDRRYIIFLGMVQYRKGIDVLIDAFIRIADRVNDTDILIVGAYTDLSGILGASAQGFVDALMRQVDEAALRARVHWIGQVDNAHEYLQSANLFCFPTRREGLPNVVAEAMAVGLVPVLSRLEGITTDFVQSDDEGRLISGDNPADYAAALLDLLDNPATMKRIGEAAQARAHTQFALDVVVDEYEMMYRRLS